MYDLRLLELVGDALQQALDRPGRRGGRQSREERLREDERALHGTLAMNAYYRCLGARIGAGALVEGRLSDPPLAELGDGAAVLPGAEVDGHFVRDGLLVRVP